MYFGAYYSLSHPKNPEYIVHSAHSFRELIEKLPRFINVATPAHNDGKMTVKVNELQQAWENANRHLACDEKGNYTGNISTSLSNFIKKCTGFFEWHRTNNPLKKKETATILAELDVAKRQLPQPISNLRIDEWTSYDDYFKKVAHHGGSNVTIEEFNSYVDNFNIFLLDRLSPRVFDDVGKLAKIIEEGERNAK